MMKKSRTILFRYGLGILLFAAGAFSSYLEIPVLPILLFVLLTVLESVFIYMEDHQILDLRMLLTWSWLLGLGLSTLKLSSMQFPFVLRTWLSTGGFYFMVLASYDFWGWRKKRPDFAKNGEGAVSVAEDENISGNTVYRKRLFQGILILTFVGFLSLLTEGIVFHFEFPIFVMGTPHAYTSFHITGIHYFVVSMSLVPPMALYFFLQFQVTKKEKTILISECLFSLLVPVLILSKLQLLLTIVFPLMVFLLYQKKYKTKQLLLLLLGVFVVLILGAALLIASRDYPELYLGRVFRFKNRKTPMYIQYPYMYIVNNFENLNLLGEKQQTLTWGVRQLFPFFALTGLKFLPAVQKLMEAEQYLTSYNLTTLTIIYDALGDFGIIGTYVFGAFLGTASYYITYNFKRSRKIFGCLMYIQFGIYMALAFFDRWFSNPTTWVWFFITFLLGLFCEKEKGQCFFRKESFRKMRGIYDKGKNV